MFAHDAIQEWARRDPERPAIRFDGTDLTYAELDAWAESFADVVTQAGGGPGKLIGVLASRSPTTVACFLGILKSGATCVPIFAQYPPARIRFVLAEVREDLACICVDDDAPSVEAAARVIPMSDVPRVAGRRTARPEPDPDSIAYMLYTSGSTGAPKGVMIKHSSLDAVVHELIHQYGIGPDDRVLHCAPLGFDTSISEIMRALCAGACLVIASAEVTGSPSFFYRLRFLEEERITRAVLPAALLRSARAVPLPELGILVTTGEACTGEVVDRWAAHRTLLNAWGSTESTFSGTIARLLPGHHGRPPVGRPIRTAEIFVVGDDGDLLPPGEVGQIHIGGLGVSAGYYQRPELTAQRFVPNVWGAMSATAFATGDRGRWLPDGQLDCLGRMDQQVKVSGYRVDMVEVETALRACGGVRIIDVAVVAVESPDVGQQLVAHVVLDATTRDGEGAASVATTIKQELGETLPAYAVPQLLRVWDSLPLNAHGKVDRHWLSTAPADSPV